MSASLAEPTSHDFAIAAALTAGAAAILPGSEPPVEAVIGGAATGAATEDAAPTLTATCTLSVTEPDAGEAVLVAQAAAPGT